jgi:hypothetical protein
MQVAMRAPGRGHNSVTIGTPEGGPGIVYPVSETGVATVHVSHQAALRSLGFRPCSEETPDVPAIAALSAEDWRAVQEFKKLQLQAEMSSKAIESADAAEKTKQENASKAAQAAVNAKK